VSFQKSRTHIDWAVDFAARHISSSIARLSNSGYSDDLILAAAVREYNAGTKYTMSKLEQSEARGDIVPLDRGTTRNNYASNVLQLARHCFPDAIFYPML
jgi:hypothetical protein